MKQNAQKYFSVTYDIIFVLLTIVPVIFINISIIGKINIELAIVITILMTLFILHHDGMPANLFNWFIMFTVGVLALGVAFLYEPIWWRVTLLLISGHIHEAGKLLNSPKSNGNPLIFFGSAACYAGVIGFTRELLKSMLFKRA